MVIFGIELKAGYVNFRGDMSAGVFVKMIMDMQMHWKYLGKQQHDAYQKSNTSVSVFCQSNGH